MPESKIQFEALFDHATIGIVVTDQDGEIINFNPFAESQFGYTKQEVIGQQVEILIPSSFHTAHRHHREGFYQEPAHRKMGEGRHLNGRKKDGSVFPVEVSISSYRKESSLFVIAFIIDITIRKKNEEMVMQQKEALEIITREVKKLNLELERKVDDRTRMLQETMAALEKSKEELSEALEKEKQLSDLKSRFVTMASHEFRTPLSTILSSAYLIEQYSESGMNGKNEKHIKRIKNAVAGLRSILEDFLSLGKLEEGAIRPRLEICSAGECINDIQEVVLGMEQIAKSGQKITFNSVGAHQVELDRSFLKNILVNLLSNAIKFSAENTTIEVQASFETIGLYLAVKDQGIGISEEDTSFLTDRFFRAGNAGNIQGTGLGLHIVVKYLELMKGSISFTSKINKGSEFTIYIPHDKSLA